MRASKGRLRLCRQSTVCRETVNERASVIGKRANLNRKGRTLKMESLERRELMAGDVAVNVAGGTLNIQGSAGNDAVHVSADSSFTTIRAGGRETRVANNYNSIRVDLGGGSDNLMLYLPRMNNLQNVSVNMGSGSSEKASVYLGSVRNLNIDSRLASGTEVLFNGAVVDQAILDFGDDAGRDRLTLEWADLRGKAVVRMGNGDDIATIKRSSIRTADFNLGAGNDRITIDNTSNIAGGTIDGGAGTDTYVKNGPALSRVSIRSFER